MAAMDAKVRDVMTTRVIAVSADAGYQQIAMVLRRYRISACPVVNRRGQVMGVVSEADLISKIAAPELPVTLSRLRWQLGQDTKENAVVAARLMTTPAVTIRAEAPVAVAARLLQERRIKRLPVVDEHYRLIGIVSRADLLSVYERSDDELAADVRRVLIAGEQDPAAFEISIGSGVVTVGGVVGSAALAVRLLGAISHADGVVAVRDRLLVAGAPALPRAEIPA
jgi:CBS-domain-containing membrane protein